MLDLNYDVILRFIKENSALIEDYKNFDMFQLLAFNDEKDKLNFIFFFTSIYFCLWSRKGDWFYVDKMRQKHYRTAGLIQALYALFNHNSFDINRVRKIDKNEFLKQMQFNDRIQLQSERYEFLINNIDQMLSTSSYSMLELANSFSDARTLANTIASVFPNFKDESEYEGVKYVFLKKAQLLVSYISNINSPNYSIKNTNMLSAFADYRVPQILRHLNLIHYNEELSEKVDNEELIETDSNEEILIRKATLDTLKFISDKLSEKNDREIDQQTLDSFFWNLSKNIDPRKIKPHHLTITTRY